MSRNGNLELDRLKSFYTLSRDILKRIKGSENLLRELIGKNQNLLRRRRGHLTSSEKLVKFCLEH
jgi:hypothetical protein